MDAGPAYQKNMSEEVSKLERLYGGGDLTKFPDFKFQGGNDCLYFTVLSFDCNKCVC